MDKYLIIILLSVIVFFIVLNIIIYKVLVQRALTKFIKPDLLAQGYGLSKTKFVGFLKDGDFKKRSLALRPFMLGSPVFSIYVYVFYLKQKDGVLRRTTAKIECILLFVRKVELSHDLAEAPIVQ